jgi:hypothetical protein
MSYKTSKTIKIIIVFIIFIILCKIGYSSDKSESESILKNDHNTTQLQPIDSLYAKLLVDYYREFEKYTESIWPGMTLCPVCIYRYNGPAFLYKHPSPPPSFRELENGVWQGTQAELPIFGSTQATIQGVLTAICYYDSKEVLEDEFFAELFHEMHHVYQFNAMQSVMQRFDNPSQVITYPENPENDALKIYENRVLLQLLFSEDSKAFQDTLDLFFSIRQKRQSIIGNDYILFEKKAESVEGPAVYCQYRMLEKLLGEHKSNRQLNIAQSEFLLLLDKPAFGRDNLRMRLLMSGLAQCLILAKRTPGWQAEYFSGNMLLNDYFFSRLPAKLTAIPDVEDIKIHAGFHLKAIHENRQHMLYDFDHQKGIRVNLSFKSIPEVRGIDPMNAIALDEHTIFHNMLKLGKNEDYLTSLNNTTLAKIMMNVWMIKSVSFYLDERSQLSLDVGKIIINSHGLQMNWRGRITEQKGKEIIIELE